MKAFVLAALVAAAGTMPAFAHVTLETGSAAAGSSYKATFRVPHGCSGAATTAIRIEVPDGFIAAKPMPKPGWSLAVKSGDYRQSYQLYGTPVKAGVVEVDWTGGNLPDAYYDEFVLFGEVADSVAAGSRLYFPVVQECGTDAARWIMIPKDGQAADALKTPAPSLLVLPAPPK